MANPINFLAGGNPSSADFYDTGSVVTTGSSAATSGTLFSATSKRGIVIISQSPSSDATFEITLDGKLMTLQTVDFGLFGSVFYFKSSISVDITSNPSTETVSWKILST